MKRTVVYWRTKEIERNKEVKAALGITSVSVNGESEYKGDLKELEPFIKEGLIVIRMKEHEQEVRRKKIYINPKQGESINSKEIGCRCRKRKV